MKVKDMVLKDTIEERPATGRSDNGRRATKIREHEPETRFVPFA